MLLANKHLTIVLGLDIHLVTLPVGPIPLPHPFIGLVMDPMDYIPFIGSSVNINGVPRGISDTSGMLGILFHIPMGGPFVMAPMIGHESVNFFGSLKVKVENVALSPSGYMLMTCNDIGVPLSLSPGKKMKPVPSLYLPTSYSIPIPMGKPVMVGGPYAPDLLGIVKNLAMSYGFGAVMKMGGKLAKKGLSALNKKVLKKFNLTQGLGQHLCKMGFEPVDLVDGRMVYEGTDFEIPGPIPIKWDRSWYSDSRYQGPLGHGMHHSYDLSLQLLPEDDMALLVLPDGRPAAFPLMTLEGDSFYHRSEKLTLTCVNSTEYRLKDHKKQQTYTFTRTAENLFRPAKLENAAGLSICFHYDQFGQLKQIVDTAGRKIDLFLNREDRIESISVSHRGNAKTLVSYAYNEVGDMISITDTLGQSTRMQYLNHLMVSKTDRNGQTFYWEYDGVEPGARCIHTWGDGGILEGWIEYSEGKNIVTNSLGEKTLYYYNEENLCTQVTDPLGNSIFHEYTEYMEPYRDIDEEGNLTGYSYDEKGNLKAITAPDGAITTFLYDEEDRCILSSSPAGATQVKVYRKDGLLHSVEGADGGVTSFEYNERGLVSEIRNNKGEETFLEYDEDHNLVKAVFPDGTKTEWQYQEFGLCRKASNNEKHAQAFTYDLLGRATKINLPDGNTVNLEYNAYDEVVHAVDKQHEVFFEYTPMGSLKTRKENGTKINFQYNTEEQLQSIINEHGEAYRFARNGRGDIIQEMGFDGLTRKYLRDRAGKVIKVERPGNRHTLYEYDTNGRISRAEHSDGTWESYSYNKDGLLTEAVNQNSHLKLERDATGRIVKEIQDGYTVESSYDKLGLRQTIKSSLGADIQLERNLAGQVSRVHAGQGNQSWEASIKYNSLGQELERVMGGVTSSFNYDYSGRVREQKVKSRGRLRRHKQYSWGVNDKLNRINDLLNNTCTTFEYDGFGNLIQSLADFIKADNYFRDEVGNIFKEKDKKDRKYGAGGKLLESKDTCYSYDEEGNLTKKSTKEGDWEYAWNGNGSLKKVRRPDNKEVSFEYDALGRRTAKIFDSHITRWVWDGNTPLHEWRYEVKDRPKEVVDEFGFLVKDKEEPVESLITWVFDEGSFKPAAKIEGDKTYSIITDYLGTPQEAYDQKGEKVWECEYEAYGKVKSCKGEQGFIPFRFQGQYEDVETGLYYNRFRYYAPEEGMYVSQDPIGLNGGMYLSSYVHNPNSWVDPSGLSGIPDFSTLKHLAENILDFSTANDGAVFWSSNDKSSNMTSAQQWAINNGKTTLEQTKGGTYLNSLRLFDHLPPHEAAEVWDIASKRFADGASGDVHVFSTGSKKLSKYGHIRTWWRIEKQALLSNPNVRNIIRMKKDGTMAKNGHLKVNCS